MGALRMLRRRMRKESPARERQMAPALELLEPRLLLSADLATAAGVLSSGLSAFDNRLDAFVDVSNYPTELNTRLPLVVRNEGADILDYHSVAPTIRDVLYVDVDINRDGYVGTNPDVSLPGGLTDAETDLDALDGNSDGKVDILEFLQGNFFDPIATHLSGSPNSTDFVDNVLVGAEAGLEDGLTYQVESIDYYAPARWIDLNITNVSDTTDDNQVSFDLDFSLTLRNELALDLGTVAEDLGIAFPDTNLIVDATLDFEVEFGVLTSGETPTADDFFLDFNQTSGDDLTLKVDGSIGTLDSDVNIGFLGTKVSGGSVTLTANLSGDVDDPTTPTTLGFAEWQFGNPPSPSGVITAANDPGVYVLSETAEFIVRIGDSDAVTVKVTPGLTTGNTTATQLANSVDQAIINAGLGDVIDADSWGNKVRLSVVSYNFTDLGFASNELILDGTGQTAGSAPTLSTPVTFVLSVDHGKPTLISVPGGTATDTVGKLVGELNTALSGTGVTASNSGGKIRLDPGSHHVQVSNDLTFDSKLTTADLGKPITTLIPTLSTSGSSFGVTLPIEKTGSGLVGGLVPVAGSPAISFPAASDPFGLTAPTADVDGNIRFDFAVDIVGVTADDRQDILNFTNISASNVVGLLRQLGNWLDNARQTDSFAALDIPLADADLSDLLDFENMVTDELLADGKLITANNDPSFATAQALAATLGAVSYNASLDELTYTVNLSHAVDSQTVPIDFSLDLSPLLDISSNSQVRLTADAGLTATLGLYLGDLGGSGLTGATTLASLGIDMAEIEAGPAVTAVNAPRIIYGRLTNDATFDIAIGGKDYRVTVYASDPDDGGPLTGTDENTTLAHLVSDIQNALQNAYNLTDAVSANLSGQITVSNPSNTNLIRLSAASTFTLTAEAGDPAVNELGFKAEHVAEGSGTYTVTTTKDVPRLVGQLTADTTFDIVIGGTHYTVTIEAGATDANRTVIDVINDLTRALKTPSLVSGAVTAVSLAGNADFSISINGATAVPVQVRADDTDGTAFVAFDGASAVDPTEDTITLASHRFITGDKVKYTDGNDTTIGGLINDTFYYVIVVDGATIKLAETEDDANSNTPIDLLSDGSGANHRLTDAANADFDDLIADINRAFIGTALEGLIVAQDYEWPRATATTPATHHVRLKAADSSVVKFELTVAGTNPAATVLMLPAGAHLYANLSDTIEATSQGDRLVLRAYADTLSFHGADDVNVSDDTITINNHGLVTGRAVTYDAAGGTAINPLSESPTHYYVIVEDADTIKLAASEADALAGTAIVLTVAGDGADHQLTAAAISAFDVDGTSASQLGFDSSVQPANKDDLVIWLSDSSVNGGKGYYTVNLDGATQISDLIGVAGKIAVQTGGKVLAEIDPDSETGLRLKDTTFPDPPTSTLPLFRVEATNASPAAIRLGILAADPVGDLDDDGDVDAEDGDGYIDGAPLTGADVAERFFIKDSPKLSASFKLSTPATSFSNLATHASNHKVVIHDDFTPDLVGQYLDITGGTNFNTGRYKIVNVQGNEATLDADVWTASSTNGTGEIKGVQASTSFGFVGVDLIGTGSLSSKIISAKLVEPAGTPADGRIYLSEMLEDLSRVGEFVDTPTFSGSGSLGSLTLEARLDPDLSLISLGTTPQFTITVNDMGNPFADPVTLPDISVSGTDLGNLVKFEDITFSNILDALEALNTFLSGIEGLEFLSKDIPLINMSVNDLLSLADKFTTALDEVKDDSAGTIQSLQAKLRNAFGLPADGSGPFDIGLNLDGDLLKFELDLGLGFNRSLGVEIPDFLNLLNLGIPGLDGLIDLSGSANLNASGSLVANLDFGVDLGVSDLTNLGDVYVYDTTGVEASISASGSDLSFWASLGPFGLFIQSHPDFASQIAISGTFSAGVEDSANSGTKAPIADVLFTSGGFDISTTGTIGGTLPVYFPTESAYLGNITLTDETLDPLKPGQLKNIGNFVFITSSSQSAPADSIVLNAADVIEGIKNFDFAGQFNLFDNILLAVDGIDMFLEGVQYLLDTQVFGVLSLPLIGDAMSEGAGFIEDVRDDFIAPLRNFIETVEDAAKDFSEADKNLVSKYIYQLLGAPGLDILQTTGNVPSGADFQGYYTGDLIGLTTNFDKYLDPQDTSVELDQTYIQWNLTMGDTYDFGTDIGFDVGIPGLGLEADGDVSVTIQWDLDLGFGISFQDGFYLDVSDSNELTACIEVSLDDSTLAGTLGFLQLSATVNPATDLGVALAIDIGEKDATGADAEKLSFTELGRIDLDAGIAAAANIDLGLDLQLSEDVVGAGAAAGFPSVGADFVLNWGIGTYNFSNCEESTFVSFSNIGNAITDGLTLVEFQNITLDLGSYVSDVLGPIVENVQEYTEPIQPLIDFITTPFPVLSDFGLNITPLDLAAAYGQIDPGLIYAIADIITLINSIPDPDEVGSLQLNFGNMTLYDNDGVGTDFTGIDLSDPNLDLGTAFDTIKTNAADLLTGVFGDNWFGDTLGTLAGEAADIMKDLTSEAAETNPWAFPILEDPMQVFGLLMGRPAVLVTYDMPKLEFEFEWGQFFSIWGPLGVSINVEFGATIDFAFGYDTLGIQEFIDSDFRNPLLLFDGFYVSDTDQPTGDGTDVPELVLNGGLWAAAEINLGVARAGVGGGVFIEIDFDLFDPDHDGRVRIKEIIGNIVNEWNYGVPALAPLAIFDVHGEITAELFAFLKIDLFLFEIDKRWNLTPPITLYEFDIPFTRPPNLATELPGGDLQINAGEFADQRLNGNISDIDEHFVVTGGGGSVQVRAPGIWDHAQTYDVTGTIIFKGGQGNDTFDASGVTDANIKFEIDGGVGNDTIKLGPASAPGPAVIYGSEGDDEIWGGSGADIIYGLGGNDTIHGGGGNDIIFGDDGRIATDSITAFFDPAGDGNDTIYGDGGNDILFGSGGDDVIYGDDNDPLTSPASDKDIIIGDGGKLLFNDTGEDKTVVNVDEIKDTQRDRFEPKGGNDLLIGNGGSDVIYGGTGNDIIDGGAGPDTLYGEDGADILYGGSGTDHVYGGDGSDTIYGERDPNLTGSDPQDKEDTGTAGGDYLYGQDGRDTIYGNEGEDEIHGGRGADTLYGDDDNDTIYGEGDPDTIYGGWGDDTIDGGASSDVVYGDNGPDDFLASPTEGTLWNTDVYGFNIPPEYLTSGTVKKILLHKSDKSASDDANDTIYGGMGGDFVDGQAGHDTYIIQLEGADNHAFTSVYDSGEDQAETDYMKVFGTMYDDEFLLRASSSLSGLAFVALLNDDPNFERVNYWQLERLRITGSFGDDYFAVDDTHAEVTIEGNEGQDRFQVGQLYRSPRDGGAYEFNHIETEDFFFTIETTVGWLSNGISKPMTIYGGTENDYFTVFHNKEVLSLFGEDGDDTFLIKAFALAGSQEPQRERTDVSGGAGVDLVQYAMNAPVNIDGGDGFDTVIIIGTEFGDDFIITKNGVYGAGLNVNFVNIESLSVDGAEGDDRFYVMSTSEKFATQIFGGLGSDTFNMSGDTPPVISNDLRGHSGVITHEIENTDTDTIYDETIIAGISANVADNDKQDPTVVISEADGSTVVTEGGAWDLYQIVLSKSPGAGKEVIVQVMAPVQTQDQEEKGSKLLMLYSTSETAYTPDRTTIALKFDDSNWDIPKTVWVGAPNNATDPKLDYDDDAIEGPATGFINHVVTSDIGIPGPLHPEVISSQVLPDGRKVTYFRDNQVDFELEGVSSGYMVYINDGPGAGQSLRIKEILATDSHTLVLYGHFRSDYMPTGASTYTINQDISAVRAVTALVHDNDKAGVIVTQTDASTELFEDGATDEIKVRLTRQPTDDVEVTLLSNDGQVEFSTTQPDAYYDGDGNLVLKFTSLNYDTDQTVTVTALDDSVREGFHHGLISFEVASTGDTDTDVSVTGESTTLTLAQGYVGLKNRPKNGQVSQVKVDSAVRNPSLYRVISNKVVFLKEAGSNEYEILPAGTVIEVHYTYVNPGYDKLEAGPVLTNIADDDVPQVKITESGASTDVIEDATYTGMATSGGTDTLTDTGAAFPDLSDYLVQITEGTGTGQVRTIDSNTATELTVTADWTTTPDDTSKYAVLLPDHDGVPFTDTYEVVLTKVPDGDVEILITPEITKTSSGPTIHWNKQVAVTSSHPDAADNGDGTLTLTFTTTNWDTPQTVKVIAVDDDYYDGDDTQVFAPQLHTVSEIQGPLYLYGDSGQGSILGVEPLMLPYELNMLPPTDAVAGVGDDGTTLTVEETSLLTDAHALNSDVSTIQDLVDEEMTVTIADGVEAVGQFRRIDDVEALAAVAGTAESATETTLTDDGTNFTNLLSHVAMPFVKITGGTGSGQLREIASYTDTTLTISSNWSTTPDATSTYEVVAGKVMEEGAVHSADGTSLSVKDPSFTANEFAGLTVKIVTGPGAGQLRQVSSNTTTKIVVGESWDTNPDNTSTFEVIDFNTIDELVVLTLNEAFVLDPEDGEQFSDISKYAVSNMSPNFFAVEEEQIDYLFVYNEDSPADNTTEYRKGLLTDSTMVGFADNTIVEEFVTKLDGKWLSGFGMGTEDLKIGPFYHPRGITYGDMEVVEINLGDGIDHFVVEDTHVRADGFQTWTIINTGDEYIGTDGDHVTVSLDSQVMELYGGTADVGTTASTLEDAAATFPTETSTQKDLAGYLVEITGGTGMGQRRVIASNTEHVLRLSKSWNVTPNQTSTYRILGAELAAGLTTTILADATNTLIDASANFDSGLLGKVIEIIDGAGAGFKKEIIEVVDSSTLKLSSKWVFDEEPTEQSRYRVYGEQDGPVSINTQAGEDTVVGSESGIPLIIFGGEGVDTISGGSADDIIFGDNGMVAYVDEDYVSEEYAGEDGKIVTLLGLARRKIDPEYVTAATDSTLTDDTAVFPVQTIDQPGLEGLMVSITDGAGFRQDPRLITQNTADTLTVYPLWETALNPDPTGVFDPTNPDLNPSKYRISYVPEDQTDAVVRDASLIIAIDETIGGDDTIVGGAGNDTIVGGLGDDDIHGNAGDDILFGDHGRVDYTPDETVGGEDGPAQGDFVPATLDRIRTTFDGVGGADTVHGDEGDDLILGGYNPAAGTSPEDDLYGGTGDDVILGDNGELDFAPDTTTTDDPRDVIPVKAKTIVHGTGGVDIISGNAGADIIMGGTAGDTLYGDDSTGSAGTADGDDVLIGDNGEVVYTDGVIAKIRTTDAVEGTGGADNITGNVGDDLVLAGVNGSPDVISGSDDVDIMLGDNGQFLYNLDGDLSTLDRVETLDTGLGGGDEIYGRGQDDIILGGKGGDLIEGNENDDLILGDFGRIDFVDGVARYAETTDHSDGGDDIIYGNEDEDVLIGGVGDDTIDGGSEDDLIFGDNVILDRSGANFDDFTSPRFRALAGSIIYDEDDVDQVDDSADYEDPTEVPVWANWDIFIGDAERFNSYGNDYIAGGGHDDTIFGQLGDDVIQGDGSIAGKLAGTPAPVEAYRNDDGTLTVVPSFEDATDGDDYIEGNGGADVIFGNLGQDDIIGGSSSLFSLTSPDLRPDESDTIFGGAGTDIARNDIGDAEMVDGVVSTDTTGHARDADMILGDNGDIFRLVGTGGIYAGDYLEFQYDNYDPTLSIIPRAARLLDYTPGGPDYVPTATQAGDDIGAADELHGESGDDFLYGMKGDDVLFGEGQDDDLIGGYGNDWISGGAGQDGILGDDGRIYTSRNGTAEPLHGIGDLAGELDQYIDTPGKIQQATINVAGALKKTVNLTPFKLGDDDTDYAQKTYDPAQADDIIYGGWGSDFLHGGDGDDAISGAEALALYYNAPANPGDILKFGVSRAGEFGAYNEYDPWSKVYWDPASGEFVTDGTGVEFLLNFDADGVDGLGRQPTDAYHGDGYDPVMTDGDDVIFGDVGNDWLVGGTGQDHLYGGYGSDLMNADDDHETNGGANDTFDTHPSYEDRAYGGAGRDYLIANTGGDRLIDWCGEFNSYIVPFAPYGMATVSRTLQPQLMEFLYDLSASDGADPTRAADTGSDPLRNGEPEGELGLVKQKDFDWHDQTGAPDDPQAGNIPGGPRDVLRSASFNAGSAEGFFADSGLWTVEGGALQVSAESLGGDAVSVYHVDEMLPNYFEIRATVNADKPTGGWKSNAFVIFDYQSEYDFKFAGINVSLDKIQMGRRTAEGWIVDVQSNIKAKPNTNYNMLVAVNGTTVTVVVDGKDAFSHVFDPRVDQDGYVYGLNAGMVGVGSDNSRGSFDNVAVQVLPPEITFEGEEGFPDTNETISFVPVSGTWQVAGGGWYVGAPTAGGEAAISLTDLGLDAGLAVDSVLTLEATLNTKTVAGILFDYYDPQHFKFAAIDAVGDRLIIGHCTARQGWVYDAVYDTSIKAGTDYDLAVSLKGTTASADVRPAGAKRAQAMVGHVFNAVTVDGSFGVLARDGAGSFDAASVKTDDPAFRGDDLRAAASPSVSDGATALTYDSLASIVDEAEDRWFEILPGAAALDLLDQVTWEIVDLSGLTLGQARPGTILIDVDAAGYGWFVDDTPADDVEFGLPGGNGELLAGSASDALGRMDLLTVVMHEMGHALGYADLTSEADAGDLMYEMLTSGTRRTETRLVAASDAGDNATTNQPEVRASRDGGSRLNDKLADWLRRHRLWPKTR